MNLTVQQLIDLLTAAVKEDPKTAHKLVLLAQYDSESATKEGVEPATGLDTYRKNVVIL